MWLLYLSGLGIGYWCGNSVCLRCVLYAHTHTHTPWLPHGVIWSPARGKASKSVCTHDVCPFQIGAAVTRLSSSPSSQQKWNTVAVEPFLNTPMIHTCSLRFPRMQLCVPHCAEVPALANVVSVDYSSFHWGNILHYVRACVCWLVKKIMTCFFFKCYCSTSTCNTVLPFIQN